MAKGVQISDNMWVNPKTVISIEHPEVGGSDVVVNGGAETNRVLHSHWTPAKVAEALGWTAD